MPTILCLDPGIAHTGLAISYEGKLASPLTTIFERDLSKLIGKITPYLAQINPDTLVIGQPSSGPLVSIAQKLSDMIASFYSGRIVLFDEDLSSKTAQKIMRQIGKNPARTKADEHQTAAALILQEYLESLDSN